MKIRLLLALTSLTALGAFAVSALADDVAVLRLRAGNQVERVILEFYEDAAPVTVANFKKLAASRFYNGTAIHRAYPHLMLQGGDPLSKKKDNSGVGTGGPGYTLPPEIGRKHIAGAVAAARLPDKINPARRSNGSQFYITLQPMPNLDGQYTVFGRVIDGQAALDKISQMHTDTNDTPVDRVVIESVHIVPREAAAAGEPQPNRFHRLFQRLF
ncbi:MAG: peptidylprolyl isomerase [Verrucomicrobiota bacterium]